MNTLKKGIRLTPRLLSALRMTGNAQSVVDIGCDHGRLSAALLQSDPSRFVTATDISPDSLAKAARLRDKCGFAGRMDVRLQDGFPSEYAKAPDCAVIAGMGGMLIADIIGRGMDICRGLERIVMQPMRGVEELRRFLFNAGFSAVDEELVLDSGRIYQLLAYRYTGSPEAFPEGFPEDYFELGHILFKKNDPLLPRFLENRLNELENSLAHARSSGKKHGISTDIDLLSTRLEQTKQAMDYLLKGDEKCV